MNNKIETRIDMLRTIIAQARHNAPMAAYRSYLKTKEFGYRAIAAHFHGNNVLELGCDESPTSAILVRWSEQLTIVDMADKFSPKIAADPVLRKAAFIRSRWEDFTPAALFSDIVLTDSLEHVDHPVQILQLCQKWLAPDGLLHIIVPNALSLHRLIGVEMGFLVSPDSFNQNDIDSGHRRVYTPHTLAADIAAAGLAIAQMKAVQVKPFTDTQAAQFSDDFLEALENISRFFPEHGAEIYARCTR